MKLMHLTFIKFLAPQKVAEHERLQIEVPV